MSKSFKCCIAISLTGVWKTFENVSMSMYVFGFQALNISHWCEMNVNRNVTLLNHSRDCPNCGSKYEVFD